MTELDKFKQMLHDVSVSDVNDGEINFSNIRELTNQLLKIIPKKLYRFRSCNEYNLKSLKNNDIWGTLVTQFNDPMECIPSYDFEQIKNFLNNELDNENIINRMNSIIDGSMPEVIKKTYPQRFLKQLAKNSSKNIDTPDFYSRLNLLKQKLISSLQDGFDEIETNFFRDVFHFTKHLYVACFSENLTSPLMWGHYADSHKGFAIEYDMTQYIKKWGDRFENDTEYSIFHLNYQLAPVIYDKNRYDATSFFRQHIESKIINDFQIPAKKLIEDDRFRIPKIVLRKSLDWQYEKEWRMFYYNLEENLPPEHKCLAENIKPTAVYMGDKTATTDNFNTLLDICKENNIPCYRMVNKYTSNTFELYPDMDNPLC